MLFVGYQAQGTLGRTILEGARMVRLFGEEIKVNARIVKLDGVSGHADRDMLLEWLRNFDKKPKAVYVNHGEDRVCDEFAGKIENELRIRATAPYNAAEYDLISGLCLEKGNTHRIDRQQISKKKYKDSSAFKRLLSATRRLELVAEQYRECANKEIGKFADQVTALADRWER